MAKDTPVLQFPVTYGDVGIGDHVIRVPISVSRESCDVEAASDLFCGHRLPVTLTLQPADEEPTQTHFDDLDEHRASVDGIADAKGFRVAPKKITTTLSFAKESVAVETMSRFAKGSGYLVLTGAPKPVDDNEGESEGEADE